jgi:hypothetical protein
MNTIVYPDSKDKFERRQINLAHKNALLAEQRRERSIEDGCIAWETWEKTGTQELELDDRRAIAKQLGVAIEKFKESKGHGAIEYLKERAASLKNTTKLPVSAKFDRLVIMPGKKGNKPLEARPAGYRALIRALAGDSDTDLHLLADRLLLNTKFHPVSKAILDEAALLLEALDVAIQQVNQKYKIWEQCKAIEEIRQPLEKNYKEAVQRGDEDAATLDLQGDIGEDSLPRRVGQLVSRWWPLEPHMLTFDFMNPPPCSGAHIAPTNTFWVKSNPNESPIAAGVCGGESILFFPHVYLGPAIEWRDGKPDKFDEDHYLWLDVKNEPEPVVKFESNEYQVYLKDINTGVENRTDSIWDMNWSMSMTARWLVIYPDPDAKRLIPAIFCFGDFLSTEMVPLTTRLIAEFGDRDRWQYLGNDASTLLQRLRDLTGYGLGDFKIMDDWCKTADRFHMNPIFKNHPGEAEKILYRRHLEKWIKEGRARLGHSSEDVE